MKILNEEITEYKIDKVYENEKQRKVAKSILSVRRWAYLFGYSFVFGSVLAVGYMLIYHKDKVMNVAIPGVFFILISFFAYYLCMRPLTKMKNGSSIAIGVVFSMILTIPFLTSLLPFVYVVMCIMLLFQLKHFQPYSRKKAKKIKFSKAHINTIKKFKLIFAATVVVTSLCVAFAIVYLYYFKDLNVTQTTDTQDQKINVQSTLSIQDGVSMTLPCSNIKDNPSSSVQDGVNTYIHSWICTGDDFGVLVYQIIYSDSAGEIDMSSISANERNNWLIEKVTGNESPNKQTLISSNHFNLSVNGIPGFRGNVEFKLNDSIKTTTSSRAAWIYKNKPMGINVTSYNDAKSEQILDDILKSVTF